MGVVTCIAPVNIAVIKYWGKRDEHLILPLNDSISTTLDTEEMRATTSVMRSPSFVNDRFWLNGKEESFENPRLRRCLMEIRNLAQGAGYSEENKWNVHICSENNFPTAAGLASSAAGYACLVYGLAKLFGVTGDVSRIARQGSGSACRSLAGGFVQWRRGTLADGSDSFAHQLFPASHWPSLRIMILVVSDKQKKVSSTSGMQRSVETSELLQQRVQSTVPHRVNMITEAINKKDFKTFAEITMKDSNQFHAVALDTFPPAFYMNDVSRAIIDFVHTFNDVCGSTKVAYTFDAGPNACLYMEEEDVPQVAALIKHLFPVTPGLENKFFTGIPTNLTKLPQEVQAQFAPHEPGLLQYCILTKLGSGACELTDPRSHLLCEDGTPKYLQSS